MSAGNIRPATPETIADAAALIRAGRLVAFPTETVYGPGAGARNGEAAAAAHDPKGGAWFPSVVVPTGGRRLRATGSGWAIGIGRLGGTLGPTIAGALLALRWTPSQLFILAALPTLATASIIFMLSNAMKEPVGSDQPDRAVTEPIPD